MSKSLTVALLFLSFQFGSRTSYAMTCRDLFLTKNIITELPKTGSLVEVDAFDPNFGTVRREGGIFKKQYHIGDRIVIGNIDFYAPNIHRIRTVRKGDLVEVEFFDPNFGTIRREGGIFKKQYHNGDRAVIGNIDFYTPYISNVRIVRPGELVEIEVFDPNKGRVIKVIGVFERQYNDGAQTVLGNSHYYTSDIRHLRIVKATSQ